MKLNTRRNDVYSEVNINDLRPEQQARVIEARLVLRNKRNNDKIKARIEDKLIHQTNRGCRQILRKHTNFLYTSNLANTSNNSNDPSREEHQGRRHFSGILTNSSSNVQTGTAEAKLSTNPTRPQHDKTQK